MKKTYFNQATGHTIQKTEQEWNKQKHLLRGFREVVPKEKAREEPKPHGFSPQTNKPVPTTEPDKKENTDKG